MNFPLFIAKKIYSDQGDKRKVSRPAIRIATIGVAIGLAVMIVTVGVVLGFKQSIMFLDITIRILTLSLPMTV